MAATPRTRKTASRHRREPDALAQAVGARIRGLREEAEFTFDAFVEETGLGRGYISELERGMVVPSITALSKVAAALDLTIADLVLGNTPREQLFEQLRKLPEAEMIRAMRLLAPLAATSATAAVPVLRVSDRRRPRRSRGSE
jgi:transcriptional regulator with XRE-family HTH domain